MAFIIGPSGFAQWILNRLTRYLLKSELMLPGSEEEPSPLFRDDGLRTALVCVHSSRRKSATEQKMRQLPSAGGDLQNLKVTGAGMVRHRTRLLKCNRGKGEREDQPSCNDTAESDFKSGGGRVRHGGRSNAAQAILFANLTSQPGFALWH